MSIRRRWPIVAAVLVCSASFGCGGGDSSKPQFEAPKLGLIEKARPGAPGGDGGGTGQPKAASGAAQGVK